MKWLIRGVNTSFFIRSYIREWSKIFYLSLSLPSPRKASKYCRKGRRWGEGNKSQQSSSNYSPSGICGSFSLSPQIRVNFWEKIEGGEGSFRNSENFWNIHSNFLTMKFIWNLFIGFTVYFLSFGKRKKSAKQLMGMTK